MCAMCVGPKCWRFTASSSAPAVASPAIAPTRNIGLHSMTDDQRQMTEVKPSLAIGRRAWEVVSDWWPVIRYGNCLIREPCTLNVNTVIGNRTSAGHSTELSRSLSKVEPLSRAVVGH